MGTEEDLSEALTESLLHLLHEISLPRDYRYPFKKECSNLVRKVKLLAPLFDDIKDFTQTLPQEALPCFSSFKQALLHAKDLLFLCHQASKLYLGLEREIVRRKFTAVTAGLEVSLDGLPYHMLAISDDVREQVKLLQAQLKRAKEQCDFVDMELHKDISLIFSENVDDDTASSALERVAEKSELKTIAEIKKESQILHHLVLEKSMEGEMVLDQMSLLLRKLKALALKNEHKERFDEENTEHVLGANGEKLSSLVIPDDFRCPISLELMKDPVIVATGQTYERSCIQKWLDSGNKTCPKTQQVLPHLILTPNYVLRNLITQWCETHRIDTSKKTSQYKSWQGSRTGEVLHGDKKIIEVLMQKLSNEQADIQRAAAGELRLLAKRNAENRIYIARAGAIPVLVSLLSTSDLRTQEHAVTALLNLSIQDNNKLAIVKAGAIDPIIEVLRNGSMEARENAAATLFSLSVVDENKVIIGASGAIPALVSLLYHGSIRGKKDAGTALFNLSIYQGNKARVVRAGVVPFLLQLLADPAAEMLDEALAILAILVSHPEGRVAIGQASTIPILVEMIRSGSPRNKENAAALMLALCQSDPIHVSIACKLGAYCSLKELAQNGNARARTKAIALLEYMKIEEKAT